MNKQRVLNTSNKFLRLLVLILVTSPAFLHAQVTQGFEAITGITMTATPECRYFDPNNTSAHQIQNYSTIGGPCGGAGLITVLHVGSPTDLGFEVILDPLGGNGPIGFSDGDAMGVATATTVMNELGAPAAAGAQAFIMEDVDGEVDMNFDLVDLTGTTTPMFSMQYFLAETGWETTDYLYVHLEITGCPSATSISLINTTGLDIDNLAIENSWNTLSADLTPHVGCSAQLIIEHSSNSSAEELGIDAISFSEGTGLPVELISFDANPMDRAVKLHWETASEENNKGFEIERSSDSRDWETLDFVEGFGTTAEINQYNFMDENPFKGLNYYRLKQVDYDGAFEYSQVRVAEWNDGDGPVKYDVFVSPNPATNSINISLPDDLIQSSELNFEVYNQLGQLVAIERKAIGDGAVQLDINSLADGFYLLRIQDNSQQYTARFIKQ